MEKIQGGAGSRQAAHLRLRIAVIVPVPVLLRVRSIEVVVELLVSLIPIDLSRQIARVELLDHLLRLYRWLVLSRPG